MRKYTISFSVIAHLVVAVVLLIAPLFADEVLPSVREAIAWVPARAVAAPEVPPIRPPAAVARRAPVTPLVAPDGVTPELDAPPDLAPPPGVDMAGGSTVTDVIGFGGGPSGVSPPPVVVAADPPPRVPLRVGGALNPPRKIVDVLPVYPPIALAARKEGVVILEAVIGEDGRVTDVKVLRSEPLLDQAAIGAVRGWRFTPTTLGGVPVPVVMTVTVEFRLQ
jgi:protein TonB